MATQKSSIDDFLLDNQTGTKKPAPASEPKTEAVDDIADDIYSDEPEDSPADVAPEPSNDDDSEELPLAAGQDDYGNDTAAPRLYTLEEMHEHTNKAVRERVARIKMQDQEMPSASQIQKAQDNFSYDPDAAGNWEQQLEAFVERTLTKVTQKQTNQAQKEAYEMQLAEEREAQFEFQDRFIRDGARFRDFAEVVDPMPFTNHMVMALRGMKDPAAFAYAASKRQAAELQRISGIKDPYAQMVEMGKLEERMRKSAPTTKAPHPVSRTREDAGIKAPKKKEGETIEDLIARADAKKRAQIRVGSGRGKR